MLIALVPISAYVPRQELQQQTWDPTRLQRLVVSNKSKCVPIQELVETFHPEHQRQGFLLNLSIILLAGSQCS